MSHYKRLCQRCRDHFLDLDEQCFLDPDFCREYDMHKGCIDLGHESRAKPAPPKHIVSVCLSCGHVLAEPWKPVQATAPKFRQWIPG